MTSEHWGFLLSERSYRAMLSLYPVDFRIRFRKEMTQIFRDCCRDEVRNGNFAGLSRLWLRVLVDLVLSISRERGRVLLDFRRLDIRGSGIIDSMVILAIIVFHLLAAGAGITLYLPRTYETANGFFIVAASVGSVLGGLGVICSLVMARFRQIQYRLINPH